MKNLISLSVILIFALFESASAQCIVENIKAKQGDFDINAGIGLVPTYLSNNTSAITPPLSLSVGYRIQDNIYVGVYTAFSSTEYRPDVKNDEHPEKYLKNNFMLTGLRLQGHFTRACFDFYGGAMASYNMSFIRTNYQINERVPEGVTLDNLRPDAITYSGYIGIRYLLKKSFGIFGEIGYGASLVNIGVAFRL